jgi:hypothetical protein
MFEGRVNCQAVLNVIMSPHVMREATNFMTCCVPIIVSQKTTPWTW